MFDDVRNLLKRAEPDVSAAWLKQYGISDPGLPTEIRDRAAPVEALLFNLKAGEPEGLARMQRDASRITEVGDPTRDWVLRRVLDEMIHQPPRSYHSRSAEGRSLWLFLHRPEQFQSAEEICEIYHHVDRKRSWTRFTCRPEPELKRADKAQLVGLASRLKRIFGEHDGSGRNIEIEQTIRTTGDRIGTLILTAKIERAPAMNLEFEAGKSVDRPVRAATLARFHLEPASGRLDVVTTRGKGSLRLDAALAFARHILKHEEPPEIWQAPEIDLGFIWGLELPTRHEDEIESVHVVGIVARRADFAAANFRIEQRKGSIWDAACLLQDATAQDPGPWEIVSAEFAAQFKRGLGVGEKRAKTLTFRVDARGDTTLDSANDRHRLFRDHYLPSWEAVWKNRRKAA